jgi:ribosomal protein S18 acetylase RimI-like enzyme
MTDLIIHRATRSDAVAVVALLDEAAAWLESRGIDHWRRGRFAEEVNQTITNGDLFVGREGGAIVGCFMLDEGSPRLSQWLVERGREPTRGVVGRLTVAREAAGRGLGVELLDAATGVAAGREIAFARLECPSESAGLRRFYLGAGFTYLGDNDIPGPNGEPWVSSVFERATGVGLS